MDSPSFNSDTDESGLFCPSIIPKRKASESTFHIDKKPKTALWSPKVVSNDKVTEAATVSSVLNPNFLDTNLRDENTGTIGEQINLEKKYHCDLQENESFSRYFSNDKSINNCPLCLNSFGSDSSYVAHMKQCAKKHKMNTQELLHALEIQKKKMKEKSLSVPVQKKPITRKKDKKKELDIKFDMTLGLALSKSLATSEQNENNKIEKKEKPFSKFEKFTSNKVSDPKKKRHKKVENSVLKERTAEVRQQIVTERASIILLENDGNSFILTNKSWDPGFHLASQNLVKFQNKDCRLWNLGENEGEVKWYVEEIETRILPEHRNESNEKTVPVKCVVESKDMRYEILKLNLSKCSLDQDWRKMINNEFSSDVFAISKDKCTFYLHSLVLSVRCPTILKKDYKFIFAKFDLSTILVFLEYLYCGTLNELNKAKLKDLLHLAKDFDHKELIDVLNCFEVNLKKIDDNSFNVLGITTQELRKENAIFELEDKDLFEDEMVDLTQSSSESFMVGDDDNKRAILHQNLTQEKRKEGELLEEKKNKLIINFETEKNLSNMNDQNEIEQKFFSQFEEDHIQNSLKLNHARQLTRRKSNYSDTKDVEDFTPENKINETCLTLSSDLDTESEPAKGNDLDNKRTSEASDCDVSYSEPYHISDFNFSPVDLNYESIITGEELKNISVHLSETLKADGDGKSEINITPLTVRETFKVKSSSKKSAKKLKKKNLDLSASKIIRKSLCLTWKTPKSNKNKKISNKSIKRKTSTKEHKWMEDLTNSIMNDISKLPMLKCSTPRQDLNTNLIEITPRSIRDFDTEEPVTPYPNYSGMGDALLKEHLGKYGLKKSLSKKKAQKILKRIYDELHPYLNEKTGKLVKNVCVETPENLRKKKSKISKGRKEISKLKTGKKLEKINNTVPIQKSNDSSQTLIANTSNFDRSMEHNSSESDSEDLSQISSQCKRGKAHELHDVMIEFLKINPDMHQNILLYEPIWLKDLQTKLKETFNKHFKKSDLEDYLDQKCITFRSESMQETNRKSKNAKLLKKKQKCGS